MLGQRSGQLSGATKLDNVGVVSAVSILQSQELQSSSNSAFRVSEEYLISVVTR